MADYASKKDVSRVRSDVRRILNKLEEKEAPKIDAQKVAGSEKAPFTGGVTGNYWTQTGSPWVSDEARKAVLTEWFWQPIRGQPRRVDTNELRQFSQTFWVNSCVTVLSDEITSMDWDIIPKEDYEYEEVSEIIKKRKEFLKHPNKNRESFTIVIRAALKDILELDAGVLVKVFSRESYDFDQLEPKSGAPMLKEKGQREMVEIYARDGASFLAETDKFGFVTGYWQYSYQIPAHPMWFNRDEICYIKRNHRSMSPYGYAPTQAVLDLIKSLHYSTIYNKRFFEESSIPDGVLSLMNTSKPEMDNFVSDWNSSFKAQPHKFAAVNSDIKWIPLGAMQKELEFLETQAWYYKLVIAMFGLTPAELGITDDVNRATAATQAELSRRKGIRPLLKLLEDYINEEIMAEFGDEGIQFQFIYDDPTEKNQALINAELELKLGLKTVNEVRDEWGLAPVPWGEGQFNQYSQQGQQGQEGEGSKDDQFGEEQGGNEYTENRERAEGKYEEISKDFFFKGKEDFKKEVSYKKDNGEEYAHERFNLSNAKLLSRGGSDRSTYELPDGKILKIVKTARGLAQNQMEGYPVDFVPELYEKGKDYVVVENYPRDDERTKEILIPFKKFSSKDWREKGKELLWEIKKLDKKYTGCDFDTLTDFDLIWGDFKKEKNWGWSVEEPYLVDAGTLNRDIMDKEYVKKFRKEWFEIVKKRREAQNNGTKVLTKGVDDGQYYREPSEVIHTNRGRIDQPQNKRAIDNLDLKKPETKKEIKNQTVCPYCGHPALSQESNPDIVNSADNPRFRCAFCHGYFMMQDLLDQQALENLEQLMTGNPSSKPVTVPSWSPKNYDFEKESNLLAKELVRYDYSKSFEDIVEYVMSKQYYLLLKKFLSDLSDKDISSITGELIKGVTDNLPIGVVARNIDKIIKDKNRSNIIARTEILRVLNVGNINTMKRRDVKKVMWLAAHDERTCKICNKFDGKVYKTGEIPEIPAHPQCRCTVSEFVEV